MPHKFQCQPYGFKFLIKDNDPYDCSPEKRYCPECGDVGHVMYHGITERLFSIKTDYINGPGGAIRGQHDGKIYDSKSAYEKSLKATGHVIVETDSRPQKRETRGDFDVKKDLKDAYQSVMSKQPTRRKRKK